MNDGVPPLCGAARAGFAARPGPRDSLWLRHARQTFPVTSFFAARRIGNKHASLSFRTRAGPLTMLARGVSASAPNR